MKRLLFILQKEWLQIFRDKSILAMMLVMPLIQLIVLPLAMNFDVKYVNVVIVDHDHSSYTQKLITKISASGYFHIVSSDAAYTTARTHIEDGSADLILELPAGFERNLVREGVQQIGMSVDAINGTKATIGSNYLSTVIRDFAAELDLNTAYVATQVPAADIRITYSNWFNPLANYKLNIVPAILVLLLTLIGGFIAALNIVREKEIGTIEQINVSPIRKWQFILGKLIPFWVIGLVVFSIGLLVCRVVYGIVPAGSVFLLYFFAAVYLVAVLGFGLLISTYSESQVQAMFIAFFFIMIFTLMSGLFTSVESMPQWARTIAELTPITHFIRVMRMIVLKGSGLKDLLQELYWLLGFAVVLNGWAIVNYRKTS